MNWFKKFSLKSKLLALCSFFLIFTVTIGCVSFIQLEKIVDNYDKVSDIGVPKLKAAYHMFLSYRSLRIELRTLGLTGITKGEADKAMAGVTKSIEEYETFDKELTKYAPVEGQKEYYDKVNAAWLDFKKFSEDVLILWKSGTPGDQEKIHKLFFKDCPEKAQVYRDAINPLMDFFQKTLDHRVEQARAAARISNTIILSLIIFILLSGLMLGWIFSTAISKTVSQIINRLSANALNVSSALNQITTSVEELSQSVTEQASSLQETSACIEQTSAMVTKNLENAKFAAESSLESQQKAHEGNVAVDKMMEAMNEINASNHAIMNQINTSNQQITGIIKVIQEIGTKTKVINDIVFQTKLLSFNASVEAARAGEHGKGFAVVAEEVGNLAQMSGNAAKEISDMLEESIKQVEEIVIQTKSQVEALVSQGKDKVASGVTVAHQCVEILNAIVKNVGSVSTLATEISNASDEQARGVSEINKAVAQLDTVTQKNAASTEQTAQAAKSLSTQAESLNAAVNELDGIVNGVSNHSDNALSS